MFGVSWQIFTRFLSAVIYLIIRTTLLELIYMRPHIQSSEVYFLKKVHFTALNYFVVENVPALLARLLTATENFNMADDVQLKKYTSLL